MANNKMAVFALLFAFIADGDTTQLSAHLL